MLLMCYNFLNNKDTPDVVKETAEVAQKKEQ